MPRTLGCHNRTSLSLWQGLVPRCAVQSCSRAAECLGGCFPLDPDTLCMGLCYSLALLDV